MQTISTQFESELKKRLNARMVEIAEILTSGQAIKDYADYRRFVGEFQGLRQVLDTYCDEVNTTLNQR
jgi:hypothetical protein